MSLETVGRLAELSASCLEYVSELAGACSRGLLGTEGPEMLMAEIGRSQKLILELTAQASMYRESLDADGVFFEGELNSTAAEPGGEEKDDSEAEESSAPGQHAAD